MYSIKCTILGDSSVGKTSIIKKYFKNDFSDKENVTLGASFWSKKINYLNTVLDLQFWDTAGQERYKSLVPMYIRNSHIVLLVFDVTNKNSFNNLNNWLNIIKNCCYNNLPRFIVIGNKIDLNLEFNKDDIKLFSNNINSNFFLVSAKLGTNITQLFNELINLSIEIYLGNIDNKRALIIDDTVSQTKELVNKGCCTIL